MIFTFIFHSFLLFLFSTFTSNYYFLSLNVQGCVICGQRTMLGFYKLLCWLMCLLTSSIALLHRLRVLLLYFIKLRVLLFSSIFYEFYCSTSPTALSVIILHESFTYYLNQYLCMICTKCI